MRRLALGARIPIPMLGMACLLAVWWAAGCAGEPRASDSALPGDSAAAAGSLPSPDSAGSVEAPPDSVPTSADSATTPDDSVASARETLPPSPDSAAAPPAQEPARAAPDTLVGILHVIWVDRRDQEETPPRLFLTDETGRSTELIVLRELLAPLGRVTRLDRQRVRVVGRDRGTSPPSLHVEEILLAPRPGGPDSTRVLPG